MLDDSYGRNDIALAVVKGQAGHLAWVAEFAAEAKASGRAGRALVNAGLRDVEVPPS